MMQIKSIKGAAIVTGVGLLLTVSALVYWQARRHWCVQTLSTGGQEVVYSWGCYQPQRFRQWSTIASRE